jgi:hypothetical protein
MAQEEKELPTAKMSLHLIAFGVVAAVVVISFGSWFFSLDISRGRQADTGIRKAGLEFSYPRSPSPNTDHPAARVAAEANPPSSGEAAAPIRFAAEDPLTSLAQPERPEASWIWDLRPYQEANPTIPEPRYTSPKQLASTPETHPARGDVQQHPAIPALAMAEAVNVTPSASPIPKPAALSVEGRAQLFQAFQIHLSSRLDQTAMVTNSTVQPKPVLSGRFGEHSRDPKSAFQYRVRKECGPIRDRELYDQCILSFRSHTR